MAVFRFLRGICIPGTMFLGNWPKISWPEKVRLRCRALLLNLHKPPPSAARTSHDDGAGAVAAAAGQIQCKVPHIAQHGRFAEKVTKTGKTTPKPEAAGRGTTY